MCWYLIQMQIVKCKRTPLQHPENDFLEWNVLGVNEMFLREQNKLYLLYSIYAYA